MFYLIEKDFIILNRSYMRLQIPSLSMKSRFDYISNYNWTCYHLATPWLTMQIIPTMINNMIPPLRIPEKELPSKHEYSRLKKYFLRRKSQIQDLSLHGFLEKQSHKHVDSELGRVSKCSISCLTGRKIAAAWHRQEWASEPGMLVILKVICVTAELLLIISEQYCNTVSKRLNTRILSYLLIIISLNWKLYA